MAEREPSIWPSPPARKAVITIELFGASIHVPPGTDAAALQVVLQVVLRAVKELA